MSEMKEQAKAVMDAWWKNSGSNQSGIASVLREVVNQLQYYNIGGAEGMIISCSAILELCEELEND